LCSSQGTLTELPDYEAFCRKGDSDFTTDRRETQLAAVEEITPDELRSLLQSKSPPLLLDVREPHETEICKIEGALLLPLSQFGNSVDELTQDRGIVIYCHTGLKSKAAARLLIDAGFRHAKFLKGGIDAWAFAVDPSMPRY
jgi:adenylyltransferase/sulfurtransferase